MPANAELNVLRQSTYMMGLAAVICTTFGIAAASQAILFDGIFSVVAVAIKALMLMTARLIAQESSPRFQFGFWHLEPIALLSESSFLLLIAIYAMASGVIGLINGGHTIDFGLATLYAATCTVLEFWYFSYLRRRNAKIGSDLIRYDTASWLLDATLSAGLLVSFTIAWSLSGTRWAHFTPYLDPLILITVAIMIVPSAIKMSIPAIKDIIQVVPVDLDEHIQAVMSAFVAEHAFSGYTSYIQKSGRAYFIDIHILIPEDMPLTTIKEFDALRYEIANRLGPDTPERWLTITFTGDRFWAD